MDAARLDHLGDLVVDEAGMLSFGWVRRYSPHAAPTIAILRNNTRFSLTVGMPPAAKPTTT